MLTDRLKPTGHTAAAALDDNYIDWRTEAEINRSPEEAIGAFAALMQKFVGSQGYVDIHAYGLASVCLYIYIYTDIDISLYVYLGLCVFVYTYV